MCTGPAQSQLPCDPEIFLSRGSGVLLSIGNSRDLRCQHDVSSQGGDRFRNQDGLRRDRVALGVQTLADRDGEKTGAAHSVKIVFACDGTNTKNFFPDFRDVQFHFALGQRATLCSIPRPCQGEQSLPVHVAKRIDGHLGDGRHVSRQHVAGQRLGQEAAPILHEGVCAIGFHECDQLPFVLHGCGAPYRGMPRQRLFDLAQRHRLSGNFDHVIDAAQRLDTSVIVPASQVIGPIGAPVGRVDEALRGLVRLIEIAASHARAHHMDFPNLSRRDLSTVGVE